VTADGSSVWTIGFDVTANTTTFDRSGQIEVTIGEQKKTITVSQVAMYVGAPSPNSFVNLAVGGKTGKTFTITTNAPDENITVTTTNTTMITNLSKSRGEVATDGSSTWTISFDVTANTNTSTRSGNIEVTIGGQKKTVNVSQVAMYVETPSPASFDNLPVGGKTGNTFTLTTNIQDEDIIVSATYPSMITNLTKSRSVQDAANGIYLWTVTFDVTENTTTSARSGTIEVTIGGQKKTVNVSQVAMYVNTPSPNSFVNLPIIGKKNNIFTIKTNIQDEDITVETTNTSLITNLTKSRSVQDAANGIYLWTVTFDVTENTTTSARSSTIEVTIGGQKKTVSVSQVTMYVNAPNPTSFVNLAVIGKKNNIFTITTNARDEDITVETTNTSLITNLTKLRSVQDAANGIYLWTVTFDVTENMTTSACSGTIEITIGGQKKTVNVSQVAMYVNAPVPASFLDLAVGGVTRNTFTITTNSTATASTSLTTTDPLMVTNLNAVRSVQNVANGIYLWTVTFDVSPNTTASPRAATISINIDGNEKTVNISQMWSPTTNTTDGLANCYMVVPGGTVSIPITRALTIGDMSASTNATVEILWKDAGVINGNPILSGSGASRTIRVNTSSMNVGNAVIALKDAAGTIYWSWHIWVVNYDPNTEGTWTNPNNTDYTFMDRNLGATAAELSLKGRGLFYQWGRKDPFPGGKEGTAGYAALSNFTGINGTAVRVSSTSTAAALLESIRKPTTFFSYKSGGADWLYNSVNTLWSNSDGKKSVYDPCPAGWQVPIEKNDRNPWYGLSSQTFTIGDTAGVNWGANALYPAAGYRKHEGGEFYKDEPVGRYMTSYNKMYQYYLSFEMDGGLSWSQTMSRASGTSVRCVRE
jgi:hypothetical protein